MHLTYYCRKKKGFHKAISFLDTEEYMEMYYILVIEQLVPWRCKNINGA